MGSSCLSSLFSLPSPSVNLFLKSGISVADVTPEDLELTQLPCESLLVSDGQINREGEEAALNACRSLRHTVDTLLELLNQANTQVTSIYRPTDNFSLRNPIHTGCGLLSFVQLEQTHTVHLSMEERFSHGREDSTQLVEQHKLLLQQIDQEVKQKSQLQLQLHKAEGERRILVGLLDFSPLRVNCCSESSNPLFLYLMVHKIHCHVVYVFVKPRQQRYWGVMAPSGTHVFRAPGRLCG